MCREGGSAASRLGGPRQHAEVTSCKSTPRGSVGAELDLGRRNSATGFLASSSSTSMPSTSKMLPPCAGWSQNTSDSDAGVRRFATAHLDGVALSAKTVESAKQNVVGEEPREALVSDVEFGSGARSSASSSVSAVSLSRDGSGIPPWHAWSLEPKRSYREEQLYATAQFRAAALAAEKAESAKLNVAVDQPWGSLSPVGERGSGGMSPASSSYSGSLSSREASTSRSPDGRGSCSRSEKFRKVSEFSEEVHGDGFLRDVDDLQRFELPEVDRDGLLQIVRDLQQEFCVCVDPSSSTRIPREQFGQAYRDSLGNRYRFQPNTGRFYIVVIFVHLVSVVVYQMPLSFIGNLEAYTDCLLGSCIALCFV